ncbi:hypothetical protein [Archangium lipolyticum]|uniref:hypothetical protein n=1 Tax=Archangium lipolyticum TaxID=2970465 RepID=UPI002149BFB1|nr:hypothetical protein [Archangium lipolyticum]
MKKALRFVVPAALLSGLVAAAFTFSAQQPVAEPAREEACVADASELLACYPPEPGCVRPSSACVWICP